LPRHPSSRNGWPPVEHQVAGEDDLGVGQPHDKVAEGVGGADELQLHAHGTDVQGQAVLEGEGRRDDLEVAVVGTGEQGGRDEPGPQHLLPAQAVPHDLRAGQQPIAQGVVGVMMGVDHGPHRLVAAHAGHGGQQRAVAALGGGGVDQHDGAVADHSAGVVHHPAPVGLEVGENARGDLPQPRRPVRRQIIGGGGHGGRLQLTTGSHPPGRSRDPS